MGPVIARQKIQQTCIQLIKRARAQDAGLSNQGIPDKMNLIPLYFVVVKWWIDHRWPCSNVVCVVVEMNRKVMLVGMYVSRSL